MKYNQRVQDIINGSWAADETLAKGTDDDRRALTMKMAEQIRHEFGPSWGTKRADPGRPQSKDTIAFKDSTGFIGWDWQNGDTRLPNQFPDSYDLTGQTFMEVADVDHLGAAPAGPGPVLGPAPAPVDLAPVYAALADLVSRIAQADAQNEIRYKDLVANIVNKPVTVVPPFPDYNIKLSLGLTGSATKK